MYPTVQSAIDDVNRRKRKQLLDIPLDQYISEMEDEEGEKDEQVDKGTVVTLDVSLGVKPADQVAVPEIITFNLSAAIATLNSAGLNYSYSGDEDGTVISQDPVPGTKVDQGATVTQLVWDNGLGQYVSSTIVELYDGNWYLETTTKVSGGEKGTFYFDTDGKAYELDKNGKLKKI